MNKLVLFLLMILAHIVYDFHIQGNLADMKQTLWWKKITEKAPHYTMDNQWYLIKRNYDHDWFAALIIHSIEWTIFIYLPIMWYKNWELSAVHVAIIIVNIVIHAATDNEKCNNYAMNLIVDQIIHLLQIIVTFVLSIYF